MLVYFRWKYCISSILEVDVKRRTKMWSWMNIKKHRLLSFIWQSYLLFQWESLKCLEFDKLSKFRVSILSFLSYHAWKKLTSWESCWGWYSKTWIEFVNLISVVNFLYLYIFSILYMILYCTILYCIFLYYTV